MNDHAPIVTLTLNPALDVSASVEQVQPQTKLRCSQPRDEPGGGGINVSRVIQRMGEATLAVAPLGGVAGGRIASLLTAESVPYSKVDISGDTRQSIAVLDDSTGSQYRFVFPGPTLSRSEVKDCQARVIDAAANSRVLVISGSMPAGSVSQLFRDIVLALPGTAVVIDTSGPALMKALQSGAHVVKPSVRELEYACGLELKNEADIANAGKDLVSNSRVDAMVVSMGGRGAMLIPSAGPCETFRSPDVTVRSTVGAGDSMVAGLAVGIRRNLALTETVTLGVAAGTAAVLTPGSELCIPADVDVIRPQVEVAVLG